MLDHINSLHVANELVHRSDTHHYPQFTPHRSKDGDNTSRLHMCVCARKKGGEKKNFLGVCVLCVCT